MINIVICDDEKSYQEILEFKIKKIFSDELNLECQIDYVSSLEDLENFIESKRVEIVFLDIMVDESNSIDWLIKRKENRSFKEQYIVMTAFPIESYRISEVESCFYLIKSKMTDEQLLKGIKKAINCVTKKEANQKIKEEIRTQQEKSEELEKLGYTMYKRDYTSDMYSINNVTEYFMGKDNALYIIYAYGNENNTNEMDVVIM